jgi:beta-mannanase
MNDPYRYPWGPQNNKAEDYIAAWRHVVQRFRQAGANNVIWVWSPHVAYEYPEAFYPGDDVVDWVATGALNYGTVARWSDWWSFEEIYTSKREHLTRWKKPVMIAEFGSLAVGGDRNAWFREALSELPHRHPEIKALLFFNVTSDATTTQQSLDWSFQQDSTIVSTVAGAVASWRTAGTATPR